MEQFDVEFALKGHNILAANHLLRPFRAWSLFSLHTQGVALGYFVPAFQAEERAAGYAVVNSQSAIRNPKSTHARHQSALHRQPNL
jgi:hypothetical protein